jgi:hypothetical protein
VPDLHRDWAHSCNIGAGTGLICARSALGLGSGSSVRHRRRDWLTPATSVPGLGSSVPHLLRDWLTCHIGATQVRIACRDGPALRAGRQARAAGAAQRHRGPLVAHKARRAAPPGPGADVA